MKLVGGVDMTGNPLLLLTAFLSMAAIQFFSIGLLGEVSARIYFSSHGKPPFSIRRQLNLESCVTESNHRAVKRAA